MPKQLYEADSMETKQSQSQKVALWNDRVQISKKELEQWADESGAKRFIKEYRGEYGITFQTRRGKVPIPPINEVFSYVQSDISTTYARDPYIAVNAKAGSSKGAALWEVILNYYWRVLKTKEELEYEILDKDLVGFGWHKVGWAVTSTGSWEQLKIEDEKLYSKFLSWKDVLWNVGSKRPPVDCSWMAQRIVMPLAELRKKYPAAKTMEGSRMPDIDDDVYRKSNYKDDLKVGVIWEIWDAKEKQILLLAENLKDKFLEDPKPWPEFLKEFPFLMYWDFAVPGASRPMSAIAPWEPQILSEMLIMGQALNHSRRWNRQLFYNGGELDENAMDKFERGDDGAAIRIAGKVGADDLRFVDYGQLPVDFYLLMDRLQAIKRNVNGQPEFAKGGVTKTGTRTIGELQLIKEGNRTRQDRKIDRLETHCENIARHMMANLKANFDFDETIKITGDTPDQVIQALGPNFDPQSGTVTFSPEEIEGEYDVDVKAGSTLPLDKQTRQQTMEVILQTVATVTASGSVSPFLNALIQEILRDYDIKSLQEAYEQELAMEQQAKAEAQQNQSVEDQKTLAETEKRAAQAKQIGIDSVISAQDAAMGPVGRAQVKSLEKPPQIHQNGKSK
jgi:hypothetical protein